MIVNPGIRRFLGSAIQRLFNSASFYAPLTHSLVPERGTGSPTFTRASTATFTDWEGVLRTVPSGCARFEGGRMVRNLLTFTEDFSNAAWVKYRAPVMTYSQPAPDGTNTATKVAPTLVGGTNAGVYASAVTGTGRTLITSFYVKPSNWTWIQINKQDGNNGVWFNLVAGTVGTQSAGTTGAIEALDDGWFRCSIVSASAATSYSEIAIVDGDNTTLTTGNSVDGIFIWHPQLEDVTGQADQTASEYVSVGVESAPAYHGSMVDGVKCFATDINGAAIPSTTLLGYQAEGARTNLCLQSNAFDNASWTKAAVSVVADQYTAPDGATTADKVLVSAGNAQHYIYLTPLSITAATYSVSFYCKYINHRWIAIDLVDSVGHLYASFDLLNGVTGAVSGGVTSSIESVGNGFYRISWTAARALRADATVYLIFNNSNTASFETWNAVGTEAVGVWGAQVELGSFASSYIPTTTAAVTRAADVDSVPTASNILAAASTVCLEFTPDHTPSGTIALWGTYVDASNYTAILHDATNLIFRKRIAGSNYDATIANAFVSGTTYKVAATWGAAGTAIYLDGVAGTPHANTTAAQIAATMQVGADGNSLQQPGAGTTNLRIWQRQLSISEGVAVTA